MPCPRSSASCAQVVSPALPPGTVLNRVELQERFGLSSTPVRDTLPRLRGEGFVDIFRQHAMVVSAIDLTAARQSQFMRRSVELEVVRVLAQAPDEELARRIRALIPWQRALAELGELEVFKALDDNFGDYIRA